MNFKHELVSAYNDMLDIKVSLGFSRHNYTSHILPFIDFCTDKYPGASEITKEIRSYSSIVASVIMCEDDVFRFRLVVPWACFGTLRP